MTRAKKSQRDVKQLILAAKKAGAKEVVVNFGQASMVIPLPTTDDEDPPGDNNNSFDKIMRGKRGE